LNRLAIPVSDQARSQRFYERLDPDGYIVEAYWEP
jgi:hypothetical protein